MSISDWVVLFFASLLLLNILLSVFGKKSKNTNTFTNTFTGAQLELDKLITERLAELVVRTNKISQSQHEIIELLKTMVAKQ